MDLKKKSKKAEYRTVYGYSIYRIKRGVWQAPGFFTNEIDGQKVLTGTLEEVTDWIRVYRMDHNLISLIRTL